MVFCIFFGISYGMVGALQFEVLMAIVGTEKFSSAIGLVLLMEAIAVLGGATRARSVVTKRPSIIAPSDTFTQQHIFRSNKMERT